MVDYMSLEEQVDADFGRARRKAFLRRLLAHLRRGLTPERLYCFEEVRRKLGAVGGVRLGRRVVRATDIVGSVGRCSEFDGAFLPASGRARARWERVDRAFQRGEVLPPVSLYEIGDSYFVDDGNHRVSVARYHRVEWIDAVVTRFRIPSSLNRHTPKPSRNRSNTRRPTTPERSRRCGRLEFQVWKQHREEMLHEGELNRLGRTLRGSRRRRGLDLYVGARTQEGSGR